MMGYDLLIFSCEGSQFGDVKTPYLANVKAYADAGGRLFLDHLHYYFLRKGPAPFPSTAAYIDPGSTPPTPSTATINTGFPKGAALADWMVARGASTTRGQMQISEPQHAATAVMGATQNWISIDRNTNDPMTPQRPAIQYMTFNTPVGAAADAQCGRAVFTSIHLNAAPAAGGRQRGFLPTRRRRSRRAAGQDAVRAGKGARVPVLRSVGLRAAGHREAGAAARAAAARRPELAAGPRGDDAARSTATATATAAADGRLAPNLPRLRSELVAGIPARGVSTSKGGRHESDVAGIVGCGCSCRLCRLERRRQCRPGADHGRKLSFLNTDPYDAVVKIQVPRGGCSATKIGARRFLTAAHCLNPGSSVGSTVRITNSLSGSSWDVTTTMTRVDVHPSWRGDDFALTTYDVGVFEIGIDTPAIATRTIRSTYVANNTLGIFRVRL